MLTLFYSYWAWTHRIGMMKTIETKNYYKNTNKKPKNTEERENLMAMYHYLEVIGKTFLMAEENSSLAE